MSMALEPTITTPDHTPCGLQGLSVLVLGLGTSGLAMAGWCARQGAKVCVADTREAPPQLAALRAQWPQVRFVCAALDAALVQGTDVRAVFVSPGLAPAQVAGVWQAAQAQGLWCGNELSLFAHALDELQRERAYQPQVLAVTGTNGKTTVTALTAQLVQRAGKRVALAGNIGPSLLDTLGSHLEQDSLPEVWVLELSSFQLHGVDTFEPSAAALLNITQDHLDWHVDMAEYAADKVHVFGRRGALVINRDDAQVTAAVAPLLVSDKAGAQRGVRAQRAPVRSVLGFGAGLPTRAGDFGLEDVNGMVWLVRAHPDDTPTGRRTQSDEPTELHLQRLMPADALRIRGRHNALNALAALALASSIGCALAPMLYGLREYRGEPHRTALVGVLNDVAYFDDSKGTNVGATVAALQGLGAERRLVVILGGDGKGQDFTPLAGAVARHARAVVLIGRDAALIESALQGSGVPMQHASDMAQAVRLASQRAHAGDGVVLSPACASFDMFDNYGHRAQVFVDAVRSLADEAGVILDAVGAMP